MMATRKISSAPEGSEQAIRLKQLHDTFCQHLVCLTVRFTRIGEDGRSDGREECRYYSCFVLSISDRWFLVTAGHALQYINEALDSPRLRLISIRLADFFGDRQGIVLREPTPFVIEKERQFFIDEKSLGLDFGFIPLSDLFRCGLEANGILPIPECNWGPQKGVEFSSYWMLGFPYALTASCNQPVPVGSPRTVTVAPVIISAEEIRNPGDLPSSVEIPRSKSPWFVGRITADFDENIKGMSGGPIFGLAEMPNEETGYAVVALQSHWYETSRIIVGCPVLVFGQLIAQHADALMARTV
jgi:hypothetical protein